MFGETDFLVKPNSSFVERRDRVKSVPHAVVGETAIIPDILEKPSNGNRRVIETMSELFNGPAFFLMK